MGDFIDITQFSVAVSCIGIFFIFSAIRVRPSKSWESSSRMKKWLLVLFGIVFQAPVAICIIYKPDIVTDTLSTEKWNYKYLLVNYLVIIVLSIVIWVLNQIFGSNNVSK